MHRHGIIIGGECVFATQRAGSSSSNHAIPQATESDPWNPILDGAITYSKETYKILLSAQRAQHSNVICVGKCVYVFISYIDVCTYTCMCTRRARWKTTHILIHVYYMAKTSEHPRTRVPKEYAEYADIVWRWWSSSSSDDYARRAGGVFLTAV